MEYLRHTSDHLFHIFCYFFLLFTILLAIVSRKHYLEIYYSTCIYDIVQKPQSSFNEFDCYDSSYNDCQSSENIRTLTTNTVSCVCSSAASDYYRRLLCGSCCRICLLIRYVPWFICKKLFDVCDTAHLSHTRNFIFASCKVGQLRNIIQAIWIFIELCLYRLFTLSEIHRMLDDKVNYYACLIVYSSILQFPFFC